MGAGIPCVVVRAAGDALAGWLAAWWRWTDARVMSDQAGSGAPDPESGGSAPTGSPIPDSGSEATSASAPSAGGGPRRHRWLVGVLFGLATLVGVFAVLAVWANRQALNTDNWTSTSSQLLANPQVQTAVASYAVAQLFASGVPQAQIKAVLPPKLQGVAGPLTSGLEQLAEKVAPRVLASAQVQTLWRAANRQAHTTLLKIINGGGSVASTNGGVVTLNLHAIVDQLASALGAQGAVSAARSKLQGNAGAVQGAASQVGVTLPPATGELVIMRSSQLKTVQDIAADIKGLALVLPIISFLLFGLAVWFARGRRRAALRTTGWCFVGVGFFVLLVRRVGGNEIVNALVKNPENRPAAHDVWTIGTSLLYHIAVALIVYGLVLVSAAWVAGDTRPARWLRRTLAPTLRERPAAVYAGVFGVLLVVVVWGPTPATRQVGYIVLFVVLLVLGVEALRRQTAREFPAVAAAGVG
jgi:hypothetical protein